MSQIGAQENREAEKSTVTDTIDITFITCFALVILMKIVCFIIGYLTVRLGYQLIASGIKGEFKFSANLGGAKADLASVSPGLLFVVLGVFLTGYAIYVEKECKTKTIIEGTPPVEDQSGPPIGSEPRLPPRDPRGDMTK